jgi:gamma-glutamyl:cysteine ligase YbdK (ATP-grasp superfamily)
MSLEKFKNRFKFKNAHRDLLGVEQEWLVVDRNTDLVAPKVPEILQPDPASRRFTSFVPELSACQIEGQVGPCKKHEIRDALSALRDQLRQLQEEHSFNLYPSEVGPEDMPLNIYPDLEGRYPRIAQKLTSSDQTHVLRAGCRITGTHVHRAIWVPDGVNMDIFDVALRVYNHVIQFTDELLEMGDGSDGERIRLYKQMAPDPTPPRFNSWEAYYARVCQESKKEDPRDIWFWIRISPNGTIEFRPFGMTDDLDVIYEWVTRCDQLCQEAMNQL